MVCVDNLKNEASIIFGICSIYLNSWATPLYVIFFRNTTLNKFLNFDNKYNFIYNLDLLLTILYKEKKNVLYILDLIITKKTSLYI